MALQLPRNKKIDELTVRNNRNITYDLNMGKPQRPAQANLSVRGPRDTPSAPNYSLAEKLVSGVQQMGGNLADISLMGGNVLEDTAASLRGASDVERKNIYDRYNTLRDTVKGWKTVTGESFNPNEDFQFTGDAGKDAATLAGRGLQTGLDATAFVNPTRLAAGGVVKGALPTAKFVARDAGFYGGLDTVAGGTQTYGETGDVNKSVKAGLERGAISALTQGSLETLGKGVGVAKNKVVKKGTEQASDIGADLALDTAASKPEALALYKREDGTKPAGFTVDKALKVSDKVQKLLKETGVSGVYKKDNPYGAAYDRTSRSVYVKDQAAATDTNLYHELGHDIYYNAMTPKERTLFDTSNGYASKQAKGRSGYTKDDLASEDFSSMLSKALRGKIDEVPEKYRSVIAKYARVSLDEIATNPQLAARAGIVNPRNETVMQKYLREQADAAPVAESIPKPVVKARDPVQAAREEQQLLEARQLSQRPDMTTENAPTLKTQGTELPTVELKSVNPDDPFNNRGVLQRLKNELGTRFDDDAKMLMLLKRIEKETGRKGLVDQYYDDTSLIRKSQAIADSKLMNNENVQAALGGLDDYTTPGRFARKVTGQSTKSELDRFDEYAVARAELSNYDGKKTSKSMEENRAIYEQGNAEFGDRYAAMNQYYKEQARRLLDAGIISKEKYAQWTSNDDYIRIQRDMEDVVNPKMSTSTARSLKSTTTAQKRKGSERDALSPTRSLLKRSQQLELEIRRNQAATNTIDVLEEYGLAVRSSAAGKNTIGRFKDGKLEHWEVPKEIKETMESVSPHVMGLAARIVGTPVRLLRAGATGLSVPFAATNYLRDQASSFIQSEAVRQTHNPANIVASLGSAMRDFGGKSTNPLWKEFEEFAGNQTMYDELRNTRGTKQALRELRKGEAGRVANRVMSPVRTLEDFIGITEKATRFQNFKGAYKKALLDNGGDVNNALVQARNAARRNSTDFARSGDLSRIANLFVPFFNASAQGVRTLTRSFKRQPVATSVKVLSTVTLPAVAAMVYNYSDQKRREAYESIKPYEKQDNLIIVTDMAEQKDDGSWEGIIKIPKPPGYRELVDPLQDVTEAFLQGKAPEANLEMLGDVISAFTGTTDVTSFERLKGSLTPQQLKPGLELEANKNTYTGNKIVPDFMVEETDDPTKRAYKDTSGTARAIAKELGISPLQVEAFIKSTGASLGQYGLNAIDRVAAATGQIPKNQIGGRDAVSDLTGRFTRASGELLDKNKSEGRKYFEAVNEQKKNLNVAEQKAYDTLHPKTKNFLGERQYDDNSVYNSAARLDTYNRYPNVFKVDKAIDAEQRKQGKPGNPLFDLKKDQLKKVLEKENLPPGAKDPELSNLFSKDWFVEYSNKKNDYFEGIKQNIAEDLKAAQKEGDKEKITSLTATNKKFNNPKNPYPETSSEVQKAMDYYSSLPSGTGEKSAWINANPTMWQKFQDNWAAVDNWQNKQRARRGLDATEGKQGEKNGYDTGGSSYSYSSGGSSKGGKRSFNTRQYAIDVDAGGDIVRPTVTVKKDMGSKPKVKAYGKRERKSLPKVTIKKSLV